MANGTEDRVEYKFSGTGRGSPSEDAVSWRQLDRFDVAAAERARAQEIEDASRRIEAAFRGKIGDPVAKPASFTVPESWRLRAQEEQRKRLAAEKEEAAKVAADTRAIVERPKVLQIDAEQWKKYHTAWTGYYNNYYKEYYAKQRGAQEGVGTDVAHEGAETGATRVDRRTGSGAVMAGRAPDSGATELKPLPASRRTRFADRVKHRLQSGTKKAAEKVKRSRLFWSIVIGSATVVIALFLQYNRLFVGTVKAYISPNGGETASMTEIDPTLTTAVDGRALLIIPKINVEVPIVLNVASDNPSQQEGMKYGVTHFAIPGASALPGQIGNFVLSGHSSNDVFDRGEYKFIFAQLERLAPGDTIYVNYAGVRYTYVVSRLETVNPEDSGKLVYVADRPFLTLVTCTPVGTAQYRLLVTAEQINPNPAGAGVAEPVGDDSEGSADDAAMPSNSPTFFERVINFFTGRG